MYSPEEECNVHARSVRIYVEFPARLAVAYGAYLETRDVIRLDELHHMRRWLRIINDVYPQVTGPKHKHHRAKIRKFKVLLTTLILELETRQ